MKTQKRVMYVITKANWGGAQRYVFDLATEAQRQGFDVSVASGGTGLLQEKLDRAGVRTIKLPFLQRDVNPFLDLKTLFSLIKLFRKEKPDVVHLNSSKIGGLGGLAARCAGTKKIIFTGHAWAWNEERSFISKKIITLAHWTTIILSHKTIAVSEEVARQIRKLPFVQNKITVIHNGVGSIDFLSKEEAREKLLPTEKEKTWIGTISELHKNKGIDFLIKAFAIVAKKFPEAVLIIIGGGEEKNNLEKLVEEKQLTDKVYFAGYVENAQKYLKAFDIFTLTSRTEAFPYVILEAGRAALPVVASRVGGIPEVITNQENGVLIPPGNIAEIARALEFLLLNKDRSRECGEKLGAKIVKEFGIGDMVQKTILLYN